MIKRELLDFVINKHSGQMRKRTSLPYVFHVFDTVSTLSRWNIKDQITFEAMAAHDVQEDIPETTEEEYLKVMSPEAIPVIYELTFIPDLTLDISPKEQKAEYMCSFWKKSVRSLVCKMSDRICNTLDFLAVDRPYAKKYWKKASELIEAVKARRQEIIDFYGIHTFNAILEDIRMIKCRHDY